MEQRLSFVCPLCGMHAPIERLEEPPFQLALFVKELGGKRKLSDEEREMRRGLKLGRGSAPGRLDYDELEVTDELKEQVAQRITELQSES